MTFQEWLKTEDGKKANDATTLKGQPYLFNRLWWAFEAGVNSGEHDRRLQETIDWYEKQIRQLTKENKQLKKELKLTKEPNTTQQPL